MGNPVQINVFCDADHAYHGAKEAIPPNAPTPMGNPVQINVFCDADHAGNKVKRSVRIFTE